MALGSIEMALLHAGAGAIGGAIMGDLRGALGAGLSELVVPAVAASFDLNNASDATTLRGLSQILGGLGSLVVQDGSLAGATSALNGFDFNGSLHPRLVRPGTPMGLLASLFPWIVQQTPGVGDNGGPPLTPDDLGQGPDPSRPPPIDPRNAGAALTAAAMGYAIYTGRTTSDGRPIFSDGNGSYVAVDPVTTAGPNSVIQVDNNGLALSGGWTEGRLTSPGNALRHWNDHGSEFPQFSNAQEYVQAAQEFVTNPPPGTLTQSRGGDTLLYNPSTNTFAVRSSDGYPRTMFRPTGGMQYWLRQ